MATVLEGKNPRFAMSIAAIAMHPLDPSLPGEPPDQPGPLEHHLPRHGEANATGDTFYGTGIYVSRDAGATWSLLTGTSG